MDENTKITVKESIEASFYLVALIWLVYLIDILIPVDLINYGIFPRKISHLSGILTHTFIHGSLRHLISNTISLFVLSSVLFFRFREKAFFSMLLMVILTGILVWIFGRPAIHIGASGLIYSLAAYMITCGFLRKDFINLFTAVLIIIFYSGLIWGLFPVNPHISWEGHLFGAISGIVIAYIKQ